MKKSLLFIGVFLLSFSAFAQTHYVKLKQPIENLKSLTDKVGKDFQVDFIKAELLSKILETPIYKIKYSLSKSESLKLHQILEKDNQVVYSSLMQTPITPPTDIPPATSDLTMHQGYLGKDPGMDVQYAWDQGGDGSHVSVRLLEYALNTAHEEYLDRNIKFEENVVVNDTAYQWSGHGTNTAGAIYAHRGRYGVSGIAHNANGLTLYPEWLRTGWDRPDAVARAIDAADVGDVLVYEMQYIDANYHYVPAEYDPIIWDLTKAATDQGLVVVAAAGNGSVNLDHALHNDYNNLGDSGAIIVGASVPDTTHATHVFSTHGSRVNINSWGSTVTTTGGNAFVFGDDPNQGYSVSYAGTSSATAVAGGAVAALQSFYYKYTGEYLTSVEMRNVLVNTGIPQPQDETRLTGTFINLRAAIEQLIVLSNEDDSFENQFLVYPNPVENQLKIRNPLNVGITNLVLFNSLGKEVRSLDINKDELIWDVSELPQGIYFLRIASEKKLEFKRVIKK